MPTAFWPAMTWWRFPPSRFSTKITSGCRRRIEHPGEILVPIEITSDYLSKNSFTLNEGWYIAKGDIGEITDRLTINGNVNLILSDDCILNATKGIALDSPNALTIWGQEKSNGKLIVGGTGISKSGRDKASGNLIINGGIVEGITPNTTLVNTYKIIEGANSTFTETVENTSASETKPSQIQNLTFRANGDFAKFKHVEVDDHILDTSNYKAWTGSTYVELNSDYLNTLDVGEHKLSVVYTDGSCNTMFSILAAKKPETTTKLNNDAAKTEPQTQTHPNTEDTSKAPLWGMLALVSLVGVYTIKKIK